MSTIVDVDKSIRPIRRSLPRIEPLRMEDAQDPKVLVRAFNALLELALKSAADISLEYTDYEDVPIVSTTSTYTFRHGYNGRVRYWITEFRPTSTASNYVPLLYEASGSGDNDTLVLTNLAVGALGAFTGTATIRIQRSAL